MANTVENDKRRSKSSIVSSTDAASNKRFTFSMIVLISLLYATSALYYLALLGNFLETLSSFVGVIIFAILAASVYGIGQYLINHDIKQINKESRTLNSSFFSAVFNAVKIVFYITAGILAIIIFEALIASEYHVGLYVSAMTISYLLAALVCGMLAYKLFSWYRLKHSISTLAFAIGFLVALIAFSTVSLVNSAYFFSQNPALTERQNIWTDHTAPYYPSLKKSDFLFNVYQLTQLTLRLTFFAFWAIAVLLVRNYAQTVGKLRFWSIAALPVITYLIAQAISYLELESSSPLFAGLIIPVGAASGGIFIAVIFLTSARKMKQLNHNFLARYLTITAFGLVLGYLSVTPSVHVIDRVHTVFPPFGVVAHTFSGFSVYLISLGFYTSALSISQDTGLRKSLRQFLSDESNKLLNNIGNAEMEQEIQLKIKKLAKEQEETLEKETGAQQSMSEDEMKQYVQDVMEEVRKVRAK